MNLFKDGVCEHVLFNVKAKTVATAVKAVQRFNQSVLIGVMAKEFPLLDEAVAFSLALQKQGVQTSAGLGDGSADQWERALTLAINSKATHLNQVFPAAALSQYVLKEKGLHTVVNGLIRPTGKPGFVAINTGPLSEQTENAEVPVKTAVSMFKEMGVSSVKFFPIEGDKRLEEVREVARAVASEGLIMEPTGGITPDNVGNIVRVCLDEGVRYVMPHLYGSLNDPATQDLDLHKLEQAYEHVQKLF